MWTDWDLIMKRELNHVGPMKYEFGLSEIGGPPNCHLDREYDDNNDDDDDKLSNLGLPIFR